MFVDFADILKTSKQFSNPSKWSNVYFEILALNVVLVFLRFLLRYYGSCYRLQHVKKQQQNTEEDKTCHKEQTCQKERNMPKKVKERRKKTEVKREKGPKLHAA